MAVSISYVILNHQKKGDGTNFIRIRVTFRRKSKYIKTSIVVEPSDLTRSGNLKNQSKIDQVTDLLKEFRDIAASIPFFTLENYDVTDVVGHILAKREERKEFRLDFAEYGRKMAAARCPNSGFSYISAVNALVRFFGRNPDISEITVKNLRSFEEFIRKEPLQFYDISTGKTLARRGDSRLRNEATIEKYMLMVSAIHHQARLDFNEPDRGIFRIPVDPFEYYTIPHCNKVTHRGKDRQFIQMMIDDRRSLKGLERLAVDTFLLSFSLMGMNACDMYECAEDVNGVLVYHRSKTRSRRNDQAEMRILLPKQVSELISDYRGSGGKMFSFDQRFLQDVTFRMQINSGLKKYAQRKGIEPFTFYAARHTWATIANSKDCGIGLDLVDECLAHSGSHRLARVYAKKDWRILWDANEKVLSLFDWK